MLAALERERRYSQLLASPATATEVGYSFGTPTAAEIEAGRTNCTTFVEACLREAGYDVDSELRVADTEHSTITGTVADIINIRAERRTAVDGTTLAPIVPEVAFAETSEERTLALADLVSRRDERTQGVVLALCASGQGTEIRSMDQLRPGDVLQTWGLTVSSGRPVAAEGHATIIARVRGVDLDTGSTVVLDERSSSAPEHFQVTSVDLLGSHFPESRVVDERGYGGRSVYIKENVSLSGSYAIWYAARPRQSPWS